MEYGITCPLKMFENSFDADYDTLTIAQRNDTTYMKALIFTFSTLGMLLSVAAFCLLIVTAILFSEWRKIYKNQLLIQFMIARFFYTFARYARDLGSILQWDSKNVTYATTISMAYTEITLVFWMYAFSKCMYDSLAKVLNADQYNICKWSLFTWIIPVIIAATMYLLYFIQFLTFKVFLTFVLLVKWPVLISNAVFLILVLRAILRNNISRPECNFKIVIMMVVLIFVFGFQQIILDVYTILYVTRIFYCEMSIVVFIYNMLTMYHCAFAIIFWVFGNKKTRELWRNIRTKTQVELT